MRLMLGLLTLFVVATIVTLYAGSYGEGVVRTAGYVATIALGGVIALLVQGWKHRRTGSRPPR